MDRLDRGVHPGWKSGACPNTLDVSPLPRSGTAVPMACAVKPASARPMSSGSSPSSSSSSSSSYGSSPTICKPPIAPPSIDDTVEGPASASLSLTSEGSGALRHSWMRFRPSGCFTTASSLGVVNVYTRPVCDTTRSSTCVPVNVANSYAFFMIPALRLLKVMWRRESSSMNSILIFRRPVRLSFSPLAIDRFFPLARDDVLLLLLSWS